MTTSGLRTPFGLISAVVLALSGLALGVLCVRAAASQVLVPGASLAMIDQSGPDLVLAQAVASIGQPGEAVDPGTVSRVRWAAAQRPLDARPYLILGRSPAVRDDKARQVALLETSQRLDPRQRLIHVFLVEQYLNGGEFAKAARQFAVLSRLVSAANDQVAQAMVLMTTDPDIRPAVRRTLSEDPQLEARVLRTLARSDVAPAQVFDLASVTALDRAGDPGSWGPELVGRLVAAKRFRDARAAWRRIYKVADDAASPLIFNAGFRDSPQSAPFNWTLAAGSLGVASPAQEGLDIEYYGRDTGDLASQMILLEPGRYRFSYSVEGGKADTESRLLWQLVCATGEDGALMDTAVVTSPTARSRTVDFAVPPGCSAQTLRLHGQAGEFPDAVSTTIRDVAIRPALGGGRS